MINIGKLDRIISIENPINTKDTFGGDVILWHEYHRCFAGFVGFSGKESEESDKETSTSVKKFLIRYYSGINEAMRIVYNGRNFDITRIDEYGRDGLVITAEAKL